MATYNNLDSLYKALGKQIESSLDKTADKLVTEAKNLIMREFYNQFQPEQYIRTWQLLDGCVRSKIIHTNNSWAVEIFMDETTAKGYRDDPIMNVWLKASRGWHGSVEQTEGRYWESFIEYTMKSWKTLLIKNGLNVV